MSPFYFSGVSGVRECCCCDSISGGSHYRLLPQHECGGVYACHHSYILSAQHNIYPHIRKGKAITDSPSHLHTFVVYCNTLTVKMAIFSWTARSAKELL